MRHFWDIVGEYILQFVKGLSLLIFICIIMGIIYIIGLACNIEQAQGFVLIGIIFIFACYKIGSYL